MCVNRRTCLSGGCLVGLIWRLWAMHWRWTTSRGQQLPRSVLSISEWRLWTSLLGPNLESTAEHCSKDKTRSCAETWGDSCRNGWQHKARRASIKLCESKQKRDQSLTNPRELWVVLQVLNKILKATFVLFFVSFFSWLPLKFLELCPNFCTECKFWLFV